MVTIEGFLFWGASWQQNKGENVWKLRDILKFILETSLYKMLTVKDNYNEQLIIDVYHNYSTSAESN